MRGFRLFQWLQPGTEGAATTAAMTGPAKPAPEAPARAEPEAPAPRAEPEPAEASETRRFDRRFRHLGEVGHGGMGSVHRAVDRELGRELAVKVLANPRNMAHHDRFFQEAQITSQLDHPNIVPIHDIGRDADGVPYLVMKLVRGGTLADTLEQAGDDRLVPENLERLLRIVIKVCEAVSFAHSRGVIHCDIKPENIMVGPFGEVYLMDWGIARPLDPDGAAEPGQKVRLDRLIEDTRGLLGTVKYMSPEQASSLRGEIDERTDVFLLGATLYHVVTGAPPYEGGPITALILRAMGAEFHSLAEVDTVPPRLAQIIEKAMALQPDDRYASVSELQGDLEHFLRGTWHLPVEHFEPGQVIFREGDAAGAAYLIVEGHCLVYKGSGDDKAILREMGPGDAFGETAVVSAKPRTATVEAVDAVKVMVVTREAMTEGLGLNSWMGRFTAALAERFRDVDDRLRKLERELGREA